MAHGTPDWGVTAGGTTVYQLTDLGELAVRLGSPISHDRRGDVAWWDDFECGLAKWVSNPGGTGSDFALSTARARNGKYSALLTAGSAFGSSKGMVKRVPVPSLLALGFEHSFSLGSDLEVLSIIYQLYDGTNRVTYEVRWVQDDLELRYGNSAGGFTAFASGIDLLQSADLFHTWKLVGDPLAGEYVRCILNDVEYPLSGIAAPVAADASLPHMLVNVVIEGRLGQNDTVYVDDAIITQNEP